MSDRPAYARTLPIAALVLAILFAHPGQDSVAAETTLPDGVFATVDGERISRDRFQAFFVQYARRKFYHGVPQGRMADLQGEAVNQLIEQRLLAHEAERRGLPGDVEKVERQLSSYEERYRDTEVWASLKEEWSSIRSQLLESTKIDQLREQASQVPEPSEQELERFYQENLDAFTEPEQSRLGIILIGVQPHETSATWEQARDQARALARQLAGGAGFAELAREHSDHRSAEDGGALGLVHDGTLAEAAQQAVNELGPGEVSAPVRLLEGYALFRLVERLPAQVHDLTDVRERARALYEREQADREWSRFVASLRQAAEIVLRSPQDTNGKD